MATAAHPVKLLRSSARSIVAYWGTWFVPIGDGELKQTNLNIFYHLGAAMGGVGRIATEMPWFDAWLLAAPATEWLVQFLVETEAVPIPKSRTAADELLDILHQVIAPAHSEHPVTQKEVLIIHHLKEQFESEFERERQNIDVFTVMPKGIYNTRLLVENTEDKFPEIIRNILPPEMFYDLRQAGRCLAFETPTACAFHMFRATEVLILRYYEVLAGKAWPHDQRDWGRYIKELNALPNVNQDATMRLDEIRKFERNPSIHPETKVSLERAPILFELCSGVIYTMAEEIRKLTI